jgi:DtxR family transcriptional regulator, Mn-dependent transcriptional regulator
MKMMQTRHTPAAEDYLKAIYEMTRQEPRASTNRIAEWMGVTPASATGMVQKLAGAEPALLDYAKHRGAALTAEGEQAALQVIRHHRLLETFLHEKLGYAWDEVHAEADRLEHVISEELEERIASALGDPRFDPHGDPIPSRQLEMPDVLSTPLSELGAQAVAVVRRIVTADNALLRYLAALGLTPGQRLRVLQVSPFDGNLQLQVGAQEQAIVLGPNVTRQIFVEPLTE